MNIIKSDIVSLHGVANSMIGGRQENQDDMAYLDTPLGFLIIVCDGMGGGPGGKTASYIVKHEIAKTLCECSPHASREHMLKMAVAHAQQALEDKIKETPSLIGMGATFVAVLLNSQSALIAHAGDSRFYRLHGKKCLFRTQDHSLVAELVRRKVMTEEDARRSPQSNVITRGLGATNNHVPEIDEIPFKKGDRFVLCTDGVWGAIKHHELIKALAKPVDLQNILANLSAQIDNVGFSNGGGHDNHTIAIFELEKDSLLKDNISWKKWVMISSIVIFFIALICFCFWIVDNKNRNKNMLSLNDIYEAPNAPSEKDFIGKVDTVVNEDIFLDKSEEKQVNDSLNNRLSDVLNKRINASDSITKKDSLDNKGEIVPKHIETIQKIINRYDSAKAISKKTSEDAQKSMAVKRKEIKELFEDLKRMTKNSNVNKSVEIICNVVDNRSSWYIYYDKKTKSYTPTKKAKEFIDKQIGRLKKTKEDLERDNK